MGSCLQKFLWEKSIKYNFEPSFLSNEEKSQIYLHCKTSEMYRFLRSWRILGLVVFLYLEIVQLYIFAFVGNSYFWRPLYFTYTGWYYFGTYSCLIVYSHYLYDI